MSQELQIDQMTTLEKLQTMEALWENLSYDNSDVPSPSWHGQALAKREKSLKGGVLKSLNWDQIKDKIRKIIHED